MVSSYVSPVIVHSAKLTSVVLSKKASILPNSAMFMVLMYFLSGMMMTYAPMDTSCLGQSSAAVLSPMSTRYSPITNSLPST